MGNSVREGGLETFEKRGLDRDLIRRALGEALRCGGDFADLYAQYSTGSSLALEDGAVNRAAMSVDLGAGIRVVVGDQTGYAFTEELTAEALLEAARIAATIAAGAPKAVGGEFRVVPYGVIYRAEEDWEQVEVWRRRKLIEEMNQAAFKADRRIRKVRVSFQDQTDTILVADSDGRLAHDVQPMGALSIACVAEHQGRREENHVSRAARVGVEGFPGSLGAQMVAEAVHDTLLLFEAVPPPPGEMPVVLAAGSSGILLHEAIGHGMEADFNRKRISIYTDKLGKTIAPPFVSIVDDGTVPGSRGSVHIDDEGTPGQRTVLVEGGVLRSFMHDRISALHYKVAPTGNGRRQSFRHRPLPRMRCTYMLPGPHRKEEIIQSVKRGLYAETFTNGQVQIGAGDFTFYVKTGYLIEDGKLTAPVKDCNLIGNGPAVLERIEMVADDLKIDTGRWSCGKDGQGVPVSQGLPTIKVGALTVGGVKA